MDGAPVGIVVLETGFPRVPGDVGNASTWPFPVLFRVLPGASPAAVVRGRAEGLVAGFLSAARELEAAGARVITTTGGFFALHQRELQRRLSALVLTSGLLCVPWLADLLPAGRRIGILTMEARSLSIEHLRACGIGPETPIAVQGLEEVGGYSNHVFIGDATQLDVERVRDEHVAAARRLLQRKPDVVAIVLQSNAMPPYAYAIAAATGLPVHDVVTLVTWAVAGHVRHSFEGWL